MNIDIYTDRVLGKWAFDKANSKKDKFCYKRSGTITLHKDHYQLWTNPLTFKKHKVYGEVILTETKLIDKIDSSEGIFRGLEMTDKSICEDIIN